MGHIFISYSHKDTDFAHKLAEALQSKGFDIWIDERLDYGSQWPHEIQKQLDSCSAFIVIMSPRSFASEWVQSELQRAKRKLKPVFPMLLEGDEPWLSVESTQYYDVRKGNLPDERFFSAINRIASLQRTDVDLPVSKPEKTPNLKKPRLKTEYIVAIIGAVATVIAALLPSLLTANPPQSSPTSFNQSPVSTIAPEMTLNPDQPSDPTQQNTSPSFGADVNDVIDSREVPMRLVPAGEFEMGSSSSAYSEEGPAHTVYLDDFYIDKYEVTNVRYKSCVDVGICQQPLNTGSATRSSYYGNSQYDDYPVVYVDWEMAKTYCETWRSAHLPTEAQWEKAARGTDGRSYPWGESIDETFANYKYNKGDTTTVGTFENGKSPYGIYDMSGNVWEWVEDRYLETYYQNSPASNPLGPDTGEFHVLRGGSWLNDEDFVRTYTRGWNDLAYFDFADFGFRCARAANP